MLARLQQITTLSLVAAVSVWAIYFAIHGQTSLAWVGAATILLGYSAFLAVEFAILALVQRADPRPSPTLLQMVKAWWWEALTAPKVFCWCQPFCSRAEPDLIPPTGTATRGVVLVHGFVCNRGLWNPWMTKLRLARVPFVAVNLEPVFGSIDDYIDSIAQAVSSLQASTGLAPVVVAHSMGGLAVRAWLSSIEDDSRVHRVITIGTPHHGTWLARFAHTVNGKQMQINGPWIRQLMLREPPQRYAKFTCIYSNCDNIVFPAATATLPGASNHHVPGTAHVHLVFQGKAYDELLRWTTAPKQADGAESRSPDSSHLHSLPSDAAAANSTEVR